MSNTSDALILSRPLYGANFGQAVGRFFRKNATFTGRASRSEFWWVRLFLVVLSVVVALPASLIVGLTSERRFNGTLVYSPVGIAATVVAILIAVALLIPEVALTVRRLHDANYSGWYYLLGLVPSVGGIIILILTLSSSRPEGVRFDKERASTPL